MAVKRPIREIAAEYHYMMRQAVVNGWNEKLHCVSRPDKFQEDRELLQTEAEALCVGCPMYALCREQGLATRPDQGVMGGISWLNRRQYQPPEIGSN